MASRRSAPLAIYLLATLSLLVVAALVGGDWAMILPPVVVFIAGATILTCAARGRTGHANPWLLLGLGVVAWGIGDAIWTWYDLARGIELPFPSLADVGYLASMPLMAAGIFLMGRGGTSHQTYRFRLLDIAIVTVGAGTSLWIFIGDATLAERSSSLHDIMLVAYPTGDLVLIVTCVYAMLSVGRTAPLTTVIVGTSFLVVADLSFAVTNAYESYSPGSLVDPLWFLAAIFIGAAALLHDGSAVDHERGASGAARSLVLLASMLAAALAIPAAALAADWFGHSVNLSTLALSVAAIMVMIVLRLSLISHELYHASASLDRSRQLRGALLSRAERATEEGRASVAAELHDGPIQSLSALLYRLEAAALAPDPDPTAIALDATRGISAEIAQLREIMRGLRPPALDERGLTSAVRDLADRIARHTHTSIEVESTIGTRLEPDMEVAMYRLVQECLVNVVQHAEAQRAHVHLRADDTEVSVTVTDDGRGFSFDSGSAMPLDEHFGLSAMRERVELAGGRWSLSSRPGVGTALTAVLPVRAATRAAAMETRA